MINTRLRLHEVTRNRHYRHHARAHKGYAELHVTNCNRSRADLVPMPPIWRAEGVAGRGYAFTLCQASKITVISISHNLWSKAFRFEKRRLRCVIKSSNLETKCIHSQELRQRNCDALGGGLDCRIAGNFFKVSNRRIVQLAMFVRRQLEICKAPEIINFSISVLASHMHHGRAIDRPFRAKKWLVQSVGKQPIAMRRPILSNVAGNSAVNGDNAFSQGLPTILIATVHDAVRHAHRQIVSVYAFAFCVLCAGPIRCEQENQKNNLFHSRRVT